MDGKSNTNETKGVSVSEIDRQKEEHHEKLVSICCSGLHGGIYSLAFLSAHIVETPHLTAGNVNKQSERGVRGCRVGVSRGGIDEMDQQAGYKWVSGTE